MRTFYLTTPIYYPNARPHVGSTYTTIVCDVIARYKRMCGYDVDGVAFLTGTDEHGEKIERAAEAAGVSPQKFVAEKRELFVSLWEKLGIPVSVYPEAAPHALRFIYTTHPDHTKSVQRILIRARERGYIEKRRYEGRYCISDERYISDGTDPVNCDICGRPAELISEENYFFRLSAFEKPLLDFYQQHPEFVQPDYRRNEVMSFVKSGLRDISISRKRLKWGIPWPDDPEQVFYVWFDALISYMTGIGYAQGENGNADFQKYWRNTGQVPGVRGQVSQDQPGTRNLEPDTGSGEIVHMIGKDILRFHAVYWPAFLMAAYPDQPEMLPTTVFAHGWLYYEQDKMSKSKGNVVYPEPIVDALDSFGAPGNDALRYYLLREAPFGQDMSFSYDALIQRFNSDLANDLGNLANRTVTMLNRYFGGELPEPMVDWRILTGLIKGDPDALAKSELVPQDAVDFIKESGTFRIVTESEILRESFTSRFDQYDFFYALANTFGLPDEAERKDLPAEARKYLADDGEDRQTFLARVNKYLSDNAPWRLAEADFQGNREKIATMLGAAAEALRFVAVLLAPVIPRSAQRIWKQLGCEGKVKNQRIDQLKWGGLKPGTQVGKAEPIFPRLDKAATLAKLHELAEADLGREKKPGPIQVSLKEVSSKVESQPEQQPIAAEALRTPNPEPQTPSPEPPVPGSSAPAPVPTDQKIAIDDFTKVEMRVGQILSAEPIPKATKLLKVQVDIGTEVRQVCAGIAEYYKPEDLVGMKVVVVANLQPRKMRGVESNGMIVAASVGEEGRPVLVTFKEDVPNGTRLK
ncbi:MAG TPA: methionine--tRNA ligase [Terriglobia bacterium]|nr:methionine--tRNA ligase [Terriglobia bacterium]